MQKVLLSLLSAITAAVLVLGIYHYNSKIDKQVAKAKEMQQSENLQAQKDNERKLKEVFDSLDTKEYNSIDQISYKSNVFNKLNKGEKTTIVFFGDSTTEQNDRTNGKPGHVNIIKNKLTEIYGYNINIVNAGHSGDDLTAMKKRLTTSVINVKPDMVIINSSLNDIRLNKTKETFKKEYADIIKEIQNKTHAEIYLRTSNVTEIPYSNERLKNELNPVTKDLAKEFKLGYIDLFEYYQSLVNKDGLEVYNKDNVHPNEKGQQEMANLIMYYLIENSGLVK